MEIPGDNRQDARTPAECGGAEPLTSGGLEARLLRSHLAVASIGLFFLLILLFFTLYLRNQIIQLARIHSPAAQASLRALHGVERSLADLRDWVTVGDTAFRDQRRTTWSDIINVNMDRLEALNRELQGHSDLESVNQTAGTDLE